ncbi:MAG: Beta-barrel assembly-enhancing protease [Chlamydiae bacterium]|nr:Beta-barrel assembly-enhancing protease [Chlamydiota bacterium]
MNRKAYYTFVGLFAGLALLLSIIFFPTGEDVAWMFFYDRQFDRSSKQFYKFFGEKQKTRAAVVPKVLLDLEFANIDDAIRTVEGYIKENPTDHEAREYLGKLYQKASRPYAYLRNLEEIYNLNPSLPVLKELKESYEELNQAENQLGALRQLVAAEAGDVADYMNLAKLYASRGQMDLAVQTLEELFHKFPVEKIDNQTVIFAVNIFIATDHDLEAFLLASNYSTIHPQDVNTIVTLSYKLLHSGNPSEARFLADLIPANRRNEPQYLELMLTLLIEKEDERGIYHVLKKEFEKETLMAPFYTRLFNLAIFYKDEKLAEVMLKTLDFKKVPQIDLVIMVDSLIAFRQQKLAELLAKNLGEEYLDEHELLKLGVTIAEKGSSEEVEALAEDEDLMDQQRLQLAQFLYSSGYREVSKKLLSKVESINDVDIELLSNITELYINLGLVDDADRLISEYTLKPGYPSLPLIQSQLYLLAAQGNIEELERRFVLRESLPIQMYVDLFLISEKTKQKETAMKLAERLNRLASTSYNQMLMARALALNGQPAEALKIIRRLKREGVDVRDNYFYTIVLAANQDELYEMELVDFLNHSVIDPDVTEPKLREYGYYLMESNFRDHAVIPFEGLADGKPFLNGDVQTLLTLWGKDLSDEQIDWIATQAEDAEGKDLAGWMSHLTYMKHPQMAIELAEAKGWEDRDVGIAYLEALEVAKERQKMKKVLGVLVEQETDLDRLEKMGQLSYDLAIHPTAEKAALKMLALKPDYPNAIRLLGFLKYVRKEFNPSYRYLEEYLQTPDATFLAWYFFGDIYWYYRHWEWSRKYFRTALCLLNKKENLDPYAEMIEAELYYKIGCVGKSFQMFEELIERYPTNAAFRIEYANILMVFDKFCRASYLIATADPENDPTLDPELMRQEIINKGLTKALLMANLNRLRCAFRIVAKLKEEYPKDTRVIALLSDLEVRIGRWWRAILWLEEGLRLEPWNEELQVLQRRIFCDKASFISGSREYKLTGAPQTEVISDLIWSHRFNQEYVGKLKVSTDKLTLTGGLVVFSGLIQDFCGTRGRGEVAIERNTEDGMTLELSGFFSREGLGAGIFYERPDLFGISRARLWYHKLTWEFTETIIDFGLEDRVEFFRSINVGPQTEFFGQGGYRWYHLRTFGESAQTWTLLAGLNYRFGRRNIARRAIGDEGALYFNYYVDSQYVTHEKRVFSPILGTEVTPLNIESRETHVWQLSFNKVFCPTFWIEGSGGASWDRIARGDVGPIAAFVAHFGSRCGPRLNLSFFHTFSSQFENETVDRFIADFVIPY